MATWANQSKNTASYTNESKNTSIWDNLGTDLLLLESGFFLILENALGAMDRLILENSGSIGSTWSNQSKS